MAVVLGNMSTLIGLMSSDSRALPSAMPVQDRDGGRPTRHEGAVQTFVRGTVRQPAPAWPGAPVRPPLAP